MRRSRSPFARQSNSKLIYYVLVIAAVLAIGIIVLQDIQAPQEHISQEIEVKLEK